MKQRLADYVADFLAARGVTDVFSVVGGGAMHLNDALGHNPRLHVTHSGEGEGLLFYGSTILPFVDHFPKNTELYRIMTTKPQELKKEDE